MKSFALPSVQSLLIEVRVRGASLGQGTAFVVEGATGPMLITNWHVLAGRHPDTKQPMSPTGGIPDELVIQHNAVSAPNTFRWLSVTEPLYSSGQPRWLEHPVRAEGVDVVALPLTNTAGVQLYPHALSGAPDLMVAPAEPVSVVGFPFGIQGGGSLAVWATGFVASEPDIDLDGLPLMLIDCRTRPGQSGSAVIVYRSGGGATMANGALGFFGGPVQRLLGCYSGRVNAESDLGMVWKATAIREIIGAAG